MAHGNVKRSAPDHHAYRFLGIWSSSSTPKLADILHHQKKKHTNTQISRKKTQHPQHLNKNF